MRNKIILSKEVELPFRTATLLKKSVNAALHYVGADIGCVVNVTVTDDEGIRARNLEFRKIDSATDVLSFPLVAMIAGEFGYEPTDLDNKGRLELGDMVVNLDRIRSQAVEYGHSEAREFAYLAVHSVLHLCGYDHMTDDDKPVMRKAEEEILAEMGLKRE